MYTSTQLFNAAMLDIFPSTATMVDFGLDLNKSLYRVYQKGIKSGAITEQDLQDSVGDGYKLTALFKDKMDLNIHVVTMWDDMGCSDDECDECT